MRTAGKLTARNIQGESLLRKRLQRECSPVVAVAFAKGGDVRACVQVQEFPFLHAVVTTSACSCSVVRAFALEATHAGYCLSPILHSKEHFHHDVSLAWLVCIEVLR